jgi:hypothetical protein
MERRVIQVLKVELGLLVREVKTDLMEQQEHKD